MTAAAEAHCRTWLIRDGVAFLGAGGDDVRRLSSAPLRKLLDRADPGRDAWAPLGLLDEALGLAERTAAPEAQGDVARRIGVHLGRSEVGPVRALALRVLRPIVLVSLAPGLWGTHFQRAGRVVARAAGPNDLHLSFSDVPVQSRALCAGVGGWMEGFLSLGARRGIAVRHVACRSDGASVCEYTAAWFE